jgi:hypothetical protein
MYLLFWLIESFSPRPDVEPKQPDGTLLYNILLHTTAAAMDIVIALMIATPIAVFLELTS